MSEVFRPGISLSISIFFVIIASAAIVHGKQALCEGLETRHLFKMERSKNANIVQYDVQLTPDNKLYQKEPVIAYWIRVTEDGRERELTFFQRKWYYGFKTKYDAGSNSVIVEMVAISVREIKVSEVEGERTSVIELSVAKEDLGKVIGKQGKTARAIRTILSAASTKIRKRSVLEIIE